MSLPPAKPRAALPPFDGTPKPRAALSPPTAKPRAALPAFDGTLEAALRAAVPAGRPRFVLVTFGNAAIGPLLRNFALHCRRAAIPHVVGAVDVAAFELLAARRTPDGDFAPGDDPIGTPALKH